MFGRESFLLRWARGARLLLGLLAYFGLGAYYNYSTYGARGADLIPCVA